MECYKSLSHLIFFLMIQVSVYMAVDKKEKSVYLYIDDYEKITNTRMAVTQFKTVNIF